MAKAKTIPYTGIKIYNNRIPGKMFRILENIVLGKPVDHHVERIHVQSVMGWRKSAKALIEQKLVTGEIDYSAQYYNDKPLGSLQITDLGLKVYQIEYKKRKNWKRRYR